MISTTNREPPAFPLLPPLQIPVFLLGVKAGTLLGSGARQVAVPHYAGLGKQPDELCQQEREPAVLLRGARVLGTALGIKAALVADAYAATVVGAAVGVLPFCLPLNYCAADSASGS